MMQKDPLGIISVSDYFSQGENSETNFESSPSQNELGIISAADYFAQQDLFPTKAQRQPEKIVPFTENSPTIAKEPSPEEMHDLEEEPGFMQKLASNPITQTILGAAKRFTSPLDLLKFAMIGEGLSDIDELEEAHAKEGIPFDRGEYIRKVFEIGETIPTQKLAEDLIQKHTGINLEPQDTFSKILRTGAEIGSTSGGKLLEQGAYSTAKKIGAGVTAATAGEAAKQAGVSEPVADILSYSLGGVGAGLTKSKNRILPSVSEQRLNEIAKKYQLPQYAGLQGKKPPSHPVVSAARKETLEHQLESTSKQALDKVIAENVPIANLRKRGINLEEMYTHAYGVVEDSTKAMGNKPVKIDPLLKHLKKEINKIKTSVPSPSRPDEVRLKILQDEYKALTNPPKKAPPAVELYGPRGELINQPPAKKGRTPKDITGDQIRQQYKKYNENVKGIYKKPEFSGAEDEVRQTYAEINNKLINALTEADKTAGNQLKYTNKIFSETQKLNRAQELVKESFADGFDPAKLYRNLGNKRNRKFLERELGKDAVSEMISIAKYGKEAQNKVLKLLKTSEPGKESLLALSPFGISMIFAAGNVGAGATAALLGKNAWNRLQGYMFSKPQTRILYKNFLKLAPNPHSAAFKKAQRDLTDYVTEEFGDEANFRKFLEEQEEE